MERRAKEQWKSNRNATKSLKLIKKIQIFTKLHGNMHFSQQKANYRKCHGHEIMN